jgi:hypothetical protein
MGVLAAGSGISTDAFVDDAIRIEKYYKEYRGTASLEDLDVRTSGALSIHINANRDGNGQRFDHWLDYAVGWYTDSLTLHFHTTRLQYIVGQCWGDQLSAIPTHTHTHTHTCRY